MAKLGFTCWDHPNNSLVEMSKSTIEEVFVGNLSYFCEEKHLFKLFHEYFQIAGVRIMHNEDRTRSLMYGFVVANSKREAMEMCRVFNGQMFMGRNIK